MQSVRFTDRLASRITIGFLIGGGCAFAVYGPFVALGAEDALADTIVSPPRIEIEPTEISNASEESNTSALGLADIAAIKSTSEQESTLRELLSDMDEDQIADLLTQSQDVLGESNRYDLQFVMIQRLAQQNPNRALSFVLEMDSSNNIKGFLTGIFEDWVHSNLDEAVKRARTLSQYHKRIALSTIMQERTDLSDITIHAIAQDLDNEQMVTSARAEQRIEEAIDAPESAWDELARDLQDDLANLRTLSRVATSWVEKSGLDVLDEVYRSLTNAQTRQSVMYHVLEEVAQTDPGGAFDYALTLESDPHNSIVNNIANIWVSSDPRSALTAAIGLEQETLRKTMVESDPRSALTAAIGLEQDTLRETMVESAIRAWALSEPKQMLEEIGTLPADLQESASKAALSEIFSESPEEATELVAAMEPSSVKTSSASSVVSVWSERDHIAALEWILNEPGVAEIKSELLSSIMHSLVGADLEFAMDIALEQPIDEDMFVYPMDSPGELGLEFFVIRSLASSDVDKAIELLPQVREGSTQVVSIHVVAQALLRKDEIDRAFDIIQKAPESVSEKVYRALSMSWVSTDPQGMLKSLDRFPSEDVRSRAAVLLATFNQFTFALSKEQIEEVKKYLTEEHAKALEEDDPELMQSILTAP